MSGWAVETRDLVKTFGDFVADIYRTCSHRQAKALVRFAVNARLIVFQGPPRFVIQEAEFSRRSTACSSTC